MPRVPLIRLSPNLPPVPLTPREVWDIYNAVKRFPISGYPALDTRFLIITGLLESAFKSPTIMPPNNESSALGYFQIIRSVRANISRRLKLPWDNTMATQALFSAYGYNELARMLRRGSIPMFHFLPDPLANFMANVRFRYVVGTGTKYFNHRDAKSFMRKLMKYYPYLATGDGPSSPGTLPRVILMNKKFKHEFNALPSEVTSTFYNIIRSFDPDANVFVSSIASSFNGNPRTKQNGPNHAQHRAIDFVITPFDTPFFYDQEGRIRSPQFHWNAYLKEHLVDLFKQGLIYCSVLIEPDHIHLDSNHEPGVSVKHGDKVIYPNLSSCGQHDGCTIEKLI